MDARNGMGTRRIEAGSLGELPRAAQAVIDAAAGRGVVAFYGEMGAGKTTLIREICARSGVRDTVTSPTFALVNQYRAGNGSPIYHFDFYRIDRVEEAFDLGYEEYFFSGNLCLVEWPEKVEHLLPADTLTVHIEVTGPESREIYIVP
jgi:tRNA threonylcarbamoyladenosine biosynthesis protein TsaE